MAATHLSTSLSSQFLSLSSKTTPSAAPAPAAASFPSGLPQLRVFSASVTSRTPLAPARAAAVVASELDVEEAEAKAERQASGEEEEFPEELRLYVGNLPFSVDSAQLAALFQQAGSVEMVELIYDKLTGRSRGFGFVTMSSVEDVEAAVEQFHGYVLDGRSLRVNSGPPPPREQSAPRAPRAEANRVFVRNLPLRVDNSALGNLFNEQGEVLEAKVILDRETGRSRGFGFVTYRSAEEVENAISNLDGTNLDGKQIRVTVAESKPPRQLY